VRPSALAVLRLMTSSNVVGCSMGKSPNLRRLLGIAGATLLVEDVETAYRVITGLQNKLGDTYESRLGATPRVIFPVRSPLCS
jgi:hypothetical protein